MSNYKTTIGIEVHVELKTNSKVFSNSLNDTVDAVNTNVSVIDLGYPGTLPRVNEKVVDLGIKTALALHCDVTRKMYFDRKNYYYPDLPKGYQITQLRNPIGRNGYLMLSSGKKIGIRELHIEEDTCKSLHVSGFTLLNYNRAGVPLLEIVSDCNMNTKEEAMEYLERLKELLFYLDVSDCKMEEGSMRCDVNVSISNSDVLGTRIEIKNIASIHEVGIAIEKEALRQEKLLEEGICLSEETRKFDSLKEETIFLRKKEIGNDYRYFPEPDIPLLVLDEDHISLIGSSLVLLPEERRKLYMERGILKVNVEKLLANKELSDYLNLFLDTSLDLKMISNLLLSDVSSYLNKTGKPFSSFHLTKEKMTEAISLFEKGVISSKIWKDIVVDVLESSSSIAEILQKNNIELNSNEEEVEAIVRKVLEENENSVHDYRSGKENAFKFLMGMVMKESKGRVNPKIANSLLRKHLDQDLD